MKQTLTEVLFADDTTLFCLNEHADFFKEKYQECIDLFGQTENVKKEERLVIDTIWGDIYQAHTLPLTILRDRAQAWSALHL